MMKLLALLSSIQCVAFASEMGDMERSRTKVPRDEYRGSHHHHMAKVLNGHVVRSHPNAKACHKWSVDELQALQATLFAHRATAHDEVYQSAGDSRALLRPGVEAFRSHWAEVGNAANASSALLEMQRDGHCFEIVMWWVHHLPRSARSTLVHVTLPTLPLTVWRKPVQAEGAAAAFVYSAHYHPSSTCLACHGGGMPWQTPDTQPPPLPRQVNGKDRARRCEEWYGEEEGGACGPCDGIAGAYWGDLPDEGIYPDCEIVADASDVPVDQRAPNSFPKAFSVEMRGADRWPRTSASANATCNYTADCSPIGMEGVPIPPQVNYHWYSQLHGVLYLDHEPGQFGGGRLRHESVYQFPTGEVGAQRALRGQFGETNVHLTEIHVQTPKMAQVGNPGVMLNLEHTNMNEANKSGADDSKLDWRRIPSSDGTCVCVPDPAGLPDFMGAYSNATYKGRVRFIPPWQKTGTGGPPDGKPVVADHWAKWTFHLFVDIETYMPVMFSSPYGGCATYGNWTIMPDALWPEWGVNPESCVNVKNDPTCKPWEPPAVVQSSSFVV